MKVKDLVEMLLKLNQEAEIGDPPEGLVQTKTISFYDDEGWVEEKIENV